MDEPGFFDDPVARYRKGARDSVVVKPFKLGEMIAQDGMKREVVRIPGFRLEEKAFLHR